MRERIQKIMQENSLSPSQFADKIGVARSGLSHVLSGRNKASIDYVLKIIDAFPAIDSHWLLTGTGGQQNSSNAQSSEVGINPLQSSLLNVNKKISKQKTDAVRDLMAKEPTTHEESFSKIISTIKNVNNERELEKVILLYSDGSFSSFQK
jgi:transcriptional regulator with XRE-family HTH domain